MSVLQQPSILVKALTSVAQAVSMAAVGTLFSRLGVIDGNARKVLSTISMKVTIPCLLFSQILTCPQGGVIEDPNACPDLVVLLRRAWPMLVLPFLWVGIGVVCGLVGAKISGAPSHLRGTIVAASAFGNSTGLPIVLLTAIAQSGIVDVSGGRELAKRNFLLLLSIYQITYPMIQWTVAGRLLQAEVQDYIRPLVDSEDRCGQPESNPASSFVSVVAVGCCVGFKKLVVAALVPPVVAILAGTFVGTFPGFRELFVDRVDFDNDGKLEWMFNAIETMGQAAVPLNMLVLGSSLATIPSFSTVHWPSTIAVAISKLVVVPAIAFGMVVAFHAAGVVGAMVPNEEFHYQLMIVACLVTATPTANNLSVMAELSGGPACKQALAAMIFLMYCLAPFLLTLWIIAFVALDHLSPH